MTMCGYVSSASPVVCRVKAIQRHLSPVVCRVKVVGCPEARGQVSRQHRPSPRRLRKGPQGRMERVKRGKEAPREPPDEGPETEGGGGGEDDEVAWDSGGTQDHGQHHQSAAAGQGGSLESHARELRGWGGKGGRKVGSGSEASVLLQLASGQPTPVPAPAPTRVATIRILSTFSHRPFCLPQPLCASHVTRSIPVLT